MNRVVFVSGVSGVGKTTLLKRAQAKLEFTHATASELIKSGLSREALEIGSSSALQQNQAALVSGLRDIQRCTSLPIVLDGHTIIFTETASFKVGLATFTNLRPTAMLTLVDRPAVVSARRANDRSRIRPPFGVEELSRQQNLALEEATAIAAQLAIPHEVASNEEDLITLLRFHLDM